MASAEAWRASADHVVSTPISHCDHALASLWFVEKPIHPGMRFRKAGEPGNTIIYAERNVYAHAEFRKRAHRSGLQSRRSVNERSLFSLSRHNLPAALEAVPTPIGTFVLQKTGSVRAHHRGETIHPLASNF